MSLWSSYLVISLSTGGFGPFISTDRVIGDYSSSVGQITYQVDGADISAKIDDLDTIMTGGRLSIENKEVLTNAYSYFLEAHGTETADRALMALTLASPEFHTSSTCESSLCVYISSHGPFWLDMKCNASNA